MEGEPPSSCATLATLLVVIVLCSIIRILQNRHRNSCPSHPIGLIPVRPDGTIIIVKPPTAQPSLKISQTVNFREADIFFPSGISAFSVLCRCGFL
jgi:hypothetical protein